MISGSMAEAVVARNGAGDVICAGAVSVSTTLAVNTTVKVLSVESLLPIVIVAPIVRTWTLAAPVVAVVRP